MGGANTPLLFPFDRMDAVWDVKLMDPSILFTVVETDSAVVLLSLLSDVDAAREICLDEEE